MALWLVRTGRHGEYEQRFVADNRIYACWEKLRADLGTLQRRQELRDLLHAVNPDASSYGVRNGHRSAFDDGIAGRGLETGKQKRRRVKYPPPRGNILVLNPPDLTDRSMSP